MTIQRFSAPAEEPKAQETLPKIKANKWGVWCVNHRGQVISFPWHRFIGWKAEGDALTLVYEGAAGPLTFVLDGADYRAWTLFVFTMLGGTSFSTTDVVRGEV